MKYIFFLVFVVVGSTSFAATWKKSVLMNYSNAKTYKELFCSEKIASVDKETCAYYQKEMGVAIQNKPAKLTQEDTQTVVLTLVSTKIRIARTEDPLIYTINGHKLNLQDFDTTEDYRNQIRHFLPKSQTSTQKAWWLSQAVAQELPGNRDLEILGAIDILISQSHRVESCESLQEFADVCIEQAKYLDAAIIQTDKGVKSPDKTVKKQQASVAREYAEKLNQLAKGVEKQTTAFDTKNLKACEMIIGNPTLGPSFRVCKETVTSYSEALRIMANRMDLQRAQDVIDSYDPGKSSSNSKPRIVVPIPKPGTR